jgi:hypothetical protein
LPSPLLFRLARPCWDQASRKHRKEENNGYVAFKRISKDKLKNRVLVRGFEYRKRQSSPIQ